MADISIIETIDGFLTNFFIIFIRVGFASLLLPGIGEFFIPMRIKLVTSLLMTFCLQPILTIGWMRDESINTIFLFAHEALAGLLFGLVFRMLVISIQVAGAMMAQTTSLSQILAPIGQEAQSSFSNILLIGAIALCMANGVLVEFLFVFIRLYQILPIGHFLEAIDIAPFIIERITSTFSTAFSFSTPFIIVAVVYNVALGLLSRAMPQLMVAFVGAPAITWMAICLLLAVTPSLLSIWIDSVYLTLDLFWLYN